MICFCYTRTRVSVLSDKGIVRHAVCHLQVGAVILLLAITPHRSEATLVGTTGQLDTERLPFSTQIWDMSDDETV